MANLTERRDKDGKLVSYSIRVHRGRDANGKQLKPWTATFKVSPSWTEKSAKKKAEAFAATFEKQCREGTATDTRRTFASYCDYVIELKESRGVKHSTITRYKELTKRIYPAIGHIKLRDLRVDHLNTLITDLSKPGVRHIATKAKAKIDLPALLKDKHIKKAQIARQSGLSESTIGAAVRGATVSLNAAQAVCDALGVKLDKAFLVTEEAAALSPKTVVEYHRLIHTVLEQAVRESLIPFNPAARVDLPKVKKPEVNYFSEETIQQIRNALETEPLKYKTLVHLLLITGARRGEILGLKWSAVDFQNNRVHICNTIMRSTERGVYEETPKTETSIRWIILPTETMTLLRQWKAAQKMEMNRLKDYYIDRGYLFAQDNGSPLYPSTVNIWLDSFSKRHKLPHINPHAFRHSMASMLYFNGVDSVSISKRLGHAQVSTTANIYAHIIEGADKRNAEILAQVFLKNA